MFAKMPRLILVACVLCPSLSWALGLGEIHLQSALNEPLRAQIDLVAAAPEELAGLRVSLASADAFTRYGIQRPSFLSSFNFQVGKAKDGHSILLVTSSVAIPEPFVTFLVEVDWSRGHVMREYTVLLDPPLYAANETASTAAPVAMPSTATAAAAAPMPAPAAATPSETTPAETSPAGTSAAEPAPAAAATAQAEPAAAAAAGPIAGGTYRVARGDTLTKIAHDLRAGGKGSIDQTMLAVFRANPQAFDGNINILRRGAILRIPGADQMAALNESEAISEIKNQMSAWMQGGGAAASRGHLRLVTPGAGDSGVAASGAGGPGAANSEAGALKDRVKDLETQLADARRLIDVRNQELSDLQHKFGVKAAPAVAAATPAVVPPPAAATTPPPAGAKPPAVAATPPAPQAATPAATPAAQPTPTPMPPRPAVQIKPTPVAPAAGTSGSWLDWLTANWWLPAAVIVVLLGGLGFAALRRRQTSQIDDFVSLRPSSEAQEAGARILGARKSPDESFVVEESGPHKAPEFIPIGETGEVPSADDTMSSESAVNLDQGDPLAEADFHMAYGLYDQAADLVRIALEKEPDRRDLRLKLLEIYFVWGNKDLFLQTAKSLEAARDRAPAGEWDKIVIMGRQICPGEPLFAQSAGSGRGAGALVDLNLEGGENHVDVELFGDPEGEHSSLDHAQVKSGDTAVTSESPHLKDDSGLDFVFDAPERGADESPTRESPTREMPARDEPTVESARMEPADVPTAESPILTGDSMRQMLSAKLPQSGADQTAEVSIDDLGLDLDSLDQTGSPAISGSHLDETDHPSDAPTMVAGVDERSRQLLAEAEESARDRDLTELERELEASFISELDTSRDDIKTAVIPADAAPTVQMPRDLNVGATTQIKTSEFSLTADAAQARQDPNSTAKLRSISADSIDLDLDQLASHLNSGDTVDQPRAAEDLFSSEVFEASQRSRRVDLDVGDSLHGVDTSVTKTIAEQATAKMPVNGAQANGDASAEFEPVTMSEVGTKLDLARAYMDMGDPEGARSILDEVVQEGSASQKQEAQRLIQSLPG